MASTRSGTEVLAERPALGDAPRDEAWSPAHGAAALAQVVVRAGSSPAVRRIATDAFWSISGSAAARILALAAAILIARQLGASAFGEYNLVLATAGMFQALAGFGLGTTATKYLAGGLRSDPEAAGRVVALSGIVAAGVGAAATLLFAALAPYVARDLLGAPGLGRALRVGSLLLLFGSVSGAQLGILTGLERFRLLAFATSGAAVVGVPLVVLGARAGGTLGAVAGLVGSAAVTTIAYAGAVLAATRAAGIAPRYRGAAREWRILLSFSLPATLSNLLLAPVTWVTSAMVAQQPEGLRELGLYSAANQWRNAIVFVATAAGAVLLPLFSRLHDAERSRAFSRAFWASFAITAATCAAAAGVIAALSPALMRTYGAEFGGATRVLVLLVAAGAISAPLAVVGHAIAGSGRMWLGFALNLCWAVVLVAAAHALRSRGAIGLSVANLAAYGVHLATSLACALLVVRRRPGGGEAHA